MSIIGSNILAGASGASGAATSYQIERSLRFSSADTPELTRTPSGASNTSKFTISFWAKRSKLSSTQMIVQTGNNYGNLFRAYWDGNDKFRFHQYNGSYVMAYVTSARYRDSGAWQHYVISIDTTLATAANRARLYVNGVEVTEWDTETNPAQNLTTGWNAAIVQRIGREYTTTYGNYYNYDGYFAEFYNIGGQQLAPTAFGEFDANNVWQPKEYSGTYGTNGFYLKFAINSSNAALGTDSSGNGNTWTVTNLTAESPLSLPAVDFDGNDALEVSPGSDWAFGTGDFTVEAFVYHRSSNPGGNYEYICDGRNNSQTAGPWAISYGYTGGTNLQFASTGGLHVGSSVTPPVKQWFHVAVARSGTSLKMFIDGVEVGSSTNSTDFSVAPTTSYIARRYTVAAHLNGYISNFRVVKGTALYTSAFTVPTAPLTNVNNTVMLICQSNSSVTAATVGSGTITAIGNPTAVTFNDSSAANDSLVDTPTNYGDDTGAGNEVRGSYATLNPLVIGPGTAPTISNGNLDVEANTTVFSRVVSTIYPTSGKWYCEVTKISGQTTDDSIGIGARTYQPAYSTNPYIGRTADSYGFYGNARKLTNNSFSSYGSSWGAIGDVMGLLMDLDNGTLSLLINGVNQGVAFTGIDTSLGWTFAVAPYNNQKYALNFGQREFVYAAPSGGYKSLCTQNLPEPVIADGSAYMDVVTYTGTGSTQTISGLGFSPDLVWIKRRSGTASHVLNDAVRGAGKQIRSDLSEAESTNTNNFAAFTSDGFTIGTGSGTNNSSQTHVAWTWDAGANSSKTYTVTVVSDSGNKYRFDGHGTSAVTLDLEEGSTYTFDQSDSSNAGHPLRFSTTSDGTHGSGSEYTTGVVTNGTPGSSGAYTKITIAASAPTLYYYCSSHSGMGGQINTNSTAGATVLSGSLNSSIYDQSQTWSTTNFNSNSNVSSSYPVTLAFDGNIDQTGGTYAGVCFPNAGGYIQFDFTEFASATSVEVFVSTYGSGWSLEVNGSAVSGVPTSNIPNASVTVSVSGFTSIKWTTVNGNNFIGVAGIKVDGKLLVDSGVSPTAVPSINSVVRASPESGFSVVSWTGTATAGSVAHGLNSSLGMILLKNYGESADWRVWHKDLSNTATNYLELNKTSGSASSSAIWNNTAPTSSVFSVATDGHSNSNGKGIVAYCFAPVSGFSSMASFTGNGSADGPFVYTGFKVAFLMMKTSSAAGNDWYIFDNKREAEYNPSTKPLYPNGSYAEQGDSRTVDLLSNGFKIRYTSFFNASSATIIYMAFASNPFKTARAR